MAYKADLGVYLHCQLMAKAFGTGSTIRFLPADSIFYLCYARKQMEVLMNNKCEL